MIASPFNSVFIGFTSAFGKYATSTEQPEPLTLAAFEDVEIVSPQNGDELIYVDGVWRNSQ
jgi:hypothetical protein